MDKEICDRQGVVENSSSSQTDPAPQTVIVIAPAEDESASGEGEGSKAKDNVLETSKVSLELEKHTCVIGVKCGGEFSGESWEGEKACRICHLSSVSDYPSEVPSDLITLGCGCKGELGIAHRQCAEAWFKLRGNRCCEICGETAKIITGVGDNKFMWEWNERRLGARSTNYSGRRGCWRGQPLCNILMTCLVVCSDTTVKKTLELVMHHQYATLNIVHDCTVQCVVQYGMLLFSPNISRDVVDPDPGL